MAGESQAKIKQFRRLYADLNRAKMAKPGSTHSAFSPDEERALDALLTALEDYRRTDPDAVQEAEIAARKTVASREKSRQLAAASHGETYTGLTPDQERAEIAAATANELAITVSPIEGQTREEEAEPTSPIEPVLVQIQNLPAAPALQPPPPIAEPVGAGITQAQGFLARLPTPGSLQYLILTLGFFLLAIVPMLTFKGKTYTRLHLLWRAVTRGARLPPSPYRQAIEQRKSNLEGQANADKAQADALREVAYAAMWGADAAFGSIFGAGDGAGGIGGAEGLGMGGAGQYMGYPSTQGGLAGSAPEIGSPGGGWLYDDKGMLVLEQPAGVQNGHSARRRRGGLR